MKIKKTLYNWLTNRFLLIIRNEENFAEKRTFSFNYAKIIVFTITFLLLVFSLCFYLIHTALFAFLNPQYNELETNKKLIELSTRVDSLSLEAHRKDVYISNFRNILQGGSPNDNFTKVSNGKTESARKDINVDSLDEIDRKLRKEIEEEEAELLTISPKVIQVQENYFLNPIEGIVNQEFNPASGFFGLEIATKSGETVKSIGDGVVIFSNFSEEGYIIGIQHKNGFISIFKQNSRLLKSTGEYVHSGEGIALPGKKNETGGGVTQLFLWKEGNPVNPENYISF